MAFLLDKNLRAHRLDRGLTQEKLARKSGVTKDHISKIERGEQKNPRHETVETLAKALGTTPAELLYGKERTAKDAKPAASGAKKPESSLGVSGKPAIASVPVVGLARAGRSGFFGDSGYPAGEGFQHIPVPAGLIERERHAYGVRLEGDSMLPSLKPGWIVVAAPSSRAQNGDFAVVRFKNGEVMVKEILFKTDGAIVLKSHNPRCEPILTHKRELVFAHKVALILPK